MSCLSPYNRPFLLTPLLVSALAIVGCGHRESALPSDVGATAEIELPASDPPVLSKALASRFQSGMRQEEILSILRDAGRDTPSAKSLVETAYQHGKLNNIRFDLTVIQGKRKVVLNFKNENLVHKTKAGFD